MEQVLYSPTQMLNARVAVEPVSQSKDLVQCPHCGREPIDTDVLFRHICSSCGVPLPLSENENYFSVLGTEPRFQQDLAALERRFYQISRALHPDRFTTQPKEIRDLSLKRMSFLNTAYQTLKNPHLLREYILTQAGLKSSGTAKSNEGVLDLAEMWFEVQDLLMDDPEEGMKKLNEMGQKVIQRQTEGLETISQLEKAYDQNPSAELPIELLRQLNQEMNKQNYLKSLLRDIDRMRKHAVTN